MIIAIDETGSFNLPSEALDFFVAVHIRENGGLGDIKKEQFRTWEKSVSRRLKGNTGEIKGRDLFDVHLYSTFR